MIASLFDQKLTQRQGLATALLTAAVQRGKLANAYLLTGSVDDDKWLLARELACFLNCTHLEAGEKLERGSCHLIFAAVEAMSGVEKAHQSYCQNCRWISQDQHPQAWLPLIGQTKSGKIPVEKARALSDELSKSSRYIRMVIVENASEETFHRPAANALLKTIEDPKEGCLFMLFARRAEDVLPTIVSRSQVIPLLGKDDSQLSLMQKQQAMSESIRQALSSNARPTQSQAHINALNFAYQMQNLLAGDGEAGAIIDAAVGLELERLSQSAVVDAHTAHYLTSLVALSETAKEQVLHYVSQKAVLESFALAWCQLKSDVRT